MASRNGGRGGAQGYEDLRDRLSRGLWRTAKSLTGEQWKLKKRQHVIRAIVSISLHPEPIRSVQQATNLVGIGPVVAQHLRHILGRACRDAPLSDRQFPSAAGALLVALYEFSEKERERKRAERKKNEHEPLILCPLDTLLAAASVRLPPEQTFVSGSRILSGRYVCGGFEQMKVMVKGSFSQMGELLVKER